MNDPFETLSLIITFLISKEFSASPESNNINEVSPESPIHLIFFASRLFIYKLVQNE